MDQSVIRKYAIDNVEPLPHPYYGPRYRVSATLIDGLHLPCVIIGSEISRVRLAEKRFKDTDFDEGILTSFICSGNRINHYEIASLSPCPYAIPISHLKNIGGETSMGWTQFHVQMDDDMEFIFGTTFHGEFFSMPDGYTESRIQKIWPASRNNSEKPKLLFREKPFFECLIKGI
jgi:hypothetical protein